MRKLLIPVLALALAACAAQPAGYNGEGAPRQARIVPLESERPLVALALGGGGTRGFAHIGVIKALERAGIVPDIVTGASSGAVVAALYAGGHAPAELERIALGVNQSDLLDFVLFGEGWIRGEALQNFVNRLVKDRPIERLAKPCAVVATEARSGRMIVFNRGDTGLAVRASASVPNLFIPPVINGEAYLDGGLTSPVPVKLARAMGADIVIAVDVMWFRLARNAAPGEIAKTPRSARFAHLYAELDSADMVLSPRTVRARMLDFGHKTANIEAGETAGREALPHLRELIARAAQTKQARRSATGEHRRGGS
jgi:NTE family protein